jgi:hypothetical protein
MGLPFSMCKAYSTPVVYYCENKKNKKNKKKERKKLITARL